MRILAYIAGALACASAMADTTLVYNAGDDPFTVRIRPGEIRIDDEGKRWQLFRQDEEAIYTVDPEAETYVRMDAGTAATIRDQMAQLRERMNSKLEELPPGKREAARAALASQVPGFSDKPADIEVAATGDSDRVAGCACEVTEVRRNGEAAESLCVAERQALDMPAAEFDTVTAMFGLMEEMLAGTGLENVGLPYLDLAGMPIRYENVSGEGRRTLSEVSHGTLSDMMFDIPHGYEAREPDLEQQ